MVGVCRIELFIPGSQSLKDKRQVVKRLTSKISHRFNVSVSEVDHHDLWQRGTIAVAHVSNTQADVERLFRRLGAFAEGISDGEIIRVEYKYYDPDRDQ